MDEITQKKRCQNCKNDFEVTSEDFNFYKKINVPFPTFCPQCRLARKLLWRNERSLYKRSCDLCKKSIISMHETKDIDCSYCNYCTHSKGCYLLFGSWFNENCGYGQTVLESKDCWDCIFVKKCELCFSSTDCTQCSQVFFSQKCSNCIESAFLYDCRNCQNCLFSYNLRNKNYYVFNKQVTKEEYHKIKKEMLSSYTALEK